MSEKDSLASKIFSESLIAIGIIIAMILIWIASLIWIFGSSTDAAKAMDALKNTGLALISLMLIGGVANSQIERAVRVGMVVIGAIVLLTLLLTITGLPSFAGLY